ncbi:DUF4340 domain-containing protein, partial [Singulisphaera rosea]
MKETTKTAVFVGVALLLTGAAFLRIPDHSMEDLAFKEQGQPFFPDFKDPFACTELRVVEFEPTTATSSEFQVKFKDGKWVIPSHYDYPADAKDRLAKTASGVMDLKKDTVRADLAQDQETMGVVDPADPKATTLQGRGKRVTLRDASEKILADFIIGKEVRKESEKGADAAGQRYVRVPDQKRIYGVNLKVELSTKFADWIETNLLKVEGSKIRKIVFDNHKVDADRGEIIPGEVLTIERKDSSSPWTLEGLPAEKELDTEKLQALTTALADLKIVGVRPKPEGLSRDLQVSTGAEIKPTTRQSLNSLVSRGFYPTAKGLYSNQGDVIVTTEEGVVYTLRYGDVVLASGLDLTAGNNDDKPAGKDEKKKDEAKKAVGATESRYLFVTAAFDPSILPPEHPPEPKKPLTIPDDPFQKAPDDPKRVAEEKAAKDKLDRETADHQKRIADGEKRVKDLTERFAGWYYVTPGDSFKSIALNREALVRDK